MIRLLALLILVSGGPAFAAARPPDTAQISIGRSHSITSTALGEVRTINVVLPAGYVNRLGMRYPVLYLIDGGIEQDLLHVAGAVHLGALWGRSAAAIVVGIETKDRRKELVGPTKDPELLRKYPTAGSSKAFRTFIREEVKPIVERNYRTSGEDAVMGESLAGLFILETYLDDPALFDAYAAIDPSLWWDKEALSRRVSTRIGSDQARRPFYLAQAREQAETPEAVAGVAKAFRRKVSRWCLTIRKDLFHSTIYQQLAPQALQFLLPAKEPAPPQFGFSVHCSDQS